MKRKPCLPKRMGMHIHDNFELKLSLQVCVDGYEYVPPNWATPTGELKPSSEAFETRFFEAQTVYDYWTLAKYVKSINQLNVKGREEPFLADWKNFCSKWGFLGTNEKLFNPYFGFGPITEFITSYSSQEGTGGFAEYHKLEVGSLTLIPTETGGFSYLISPVDLEEGLRAALLISENNFNAKKCWDPSEMQQVEFLSIRD